MTSLRISPGRPAFLASVKNAEEAVNALAGGADILDCKDPEQGALGSVAPDVIRDIVAVSAGKPVSATLGDLPNDPGLVAAKACEIAETGVEFIKWGLFDKQGARAVMRALAAAVEHQSLVAVMMADRDPDFSLIPALADNDFSVVMLDTADKSQGSLRQVLPEVRIRAFVETAARAGLENGLAGSLTIEDIEALVRHGPTVLGFRGALCDASRTGRLELGKVRAVRTAIDLATPPEAVTQPRRRAAL